MAASSSSRLRMALNMSSSITSTTLKTKKTIETNKGIEFAISSCAVQSSRKIGEGLDRLIRSDPSFRSKVPSTKDWVDKFFERWTMAVECLNKYRVDRKDVFIGAGASAAAVAATIRRMGGVVKEEALTGSSSVKADSYNWISSMWTMEETSSDFINCNLLKNC